MPDSNLFSVIIPVHNGAAFIADAVASVRAAELQAVEIIVVDDGSTDDTAGVVADLGVRYCRQAQRGPAAARNRGYELAAGDFIGFLDADDWWSPTVLRRCREILATQPQYDIVQGLIQDVPPASDAYPYINLGSAVFRREAWARVGGCDEELLFCEDYDWFLRAYELRVPKLRLAETLLFRRLHAASMTHGKSIHDISLARAHHKAVKRRRAGRANAPLPHDFPTLTEYLGHPAQRNTTALLRHDLFGRQSDSGQWTVAGSQSENSGQWTVAGGQLGNGPQVSTQSGSDGLRLVVAGEQSESGLSAARSPTDHRPLTTDHLPAARQLTRRESKTIQFDGDARLAFACMRNEMLRLPYWLEYYRRLGVARFFIVDNASHDGTADYLAAQPDVYLWHTDASHAAARSGADWLEALLRAYGAGHWCVIADADELLYYADCETRPLRDFCATLERQDRQAVVGVLLEMYSDRPWRETHYQAGQDFRNVCPYFDHTFCHYESLNFYGHYQHPSYFGGMRQRVFGVPPSYRGDAARTFYCLNKAILLKYEPSFRLSAGWHWLAGARVAERAACVLHFKYLASPADAAQSAPHSVIWDAQRARYAHKSTINNDLTLYDAAHSLRLTHSRELVELGVIREI